MTLKERVLDAIGLERLTNKDALLAELAELPGETLDIVLGDNRLTEALDWMCCDDCKAAHGGECPLPEDQDITEDTPCPLTVGQWLEMPCTRERLLPEDLTNGE